MFSFIPQLKSYLYCTLAIVLFLILVMYWLRGLMNSDLYVVSSFQEMAHGSLQTVNFSVCFCLVSTVVFYIYFTV